MRINDKQGKNKLTWLYHIGFLIILALPILMLSPYFFPPDFGKTIAFRSILAILLFVCCWQIFYQKNQVSLADLKKNNIAWALGALFFTYLLASIFSVDPYFSFWGSPYRGGGFITFGFYIAFAILIFLLAKKDDWGKIWDVSLCTGIGVSLVAIAQYYGIFTQSLARPEATMGNPDLLAAYLLLLLIPALAFCLSATKLWKKVSYGACAILFFLVIAATGSRAVYAGLFMGLLYFFFWYPKQKNQTAPGEHNKIPAVKIAVIGILALALCVIVYANTAPKYPTFVRSNHFATLVLSRLSLKSFLQDPRFAAWHIELGIAEAKPLLGFGPENFSVGFDKYYDPSIRYLGGDIDWWDRAHNIVMQTISDAGVIGLIAYLGLLITIFWQLEKKYRDNDNNQNHIVPRAIQATLLAYFIANLFSFDGFSSYLLFFLLIGYAMFLIYDNQIKEPKSQFQKNMPLTFAAVAILFCALVIFLWQYNLVPLQINAQINNAQNLANVGQCDQALSMMNNILKEHSFLDSYARLEYVEVTKTCAQFYPQNTLEYFQQGLPLINQAVKIQPLYTRYWIYLANTNDTLAAAEQNPANKQNFLNQASYDLAQASQLAPKHPEILVEQAHRQMVLANYPAMEQYAHQCIALDNNLPDCYWQLALSQIYLKDTSDAKANMELANSKGYSTQSLVSLNQLSDAYQSIPDFTDLASVYQQLISQNPNVAQYYSSLAFFYKELGQYSLARQEALKVLQLSPQSKPNVDAFLETLPQN